MSRRHRRGGMVDRPKASIDMNSLIDLTFLLLVTFILTIPALEQGISIILPRGKTDTLQVKEHKPATITIDAENRYFLDKSPTTLEALEKQIEEYALRDSFILEGLTDNPYPYMKASDVVVQPSRWEGKSLVLDEAKILGKAIVVTDYTSVSDQIRDGVTGIVTGMEPEQIAQGIERVLSDTGLRRDLEENCRSEKGDWVESLNTFYKMIDV